MNRSIKISLLAAAVLAVACQGNQKKEEGAAAAPQAPAAGVEQLIRVSADTARTMDVAQTEVYTSTVQAYAVNNIAPLSGGRIRKINVEVGSFVGRGQVLAVMDDAQLAQTQLKLVNDSTELERLRALYREGGVSQSDFEAAEMAFNVSRKSYENLVENTYLRSPISGVVSARNYDRGDLYAGQPIFVVQQITPVKLLVGISETDYTQVHVGDEVSITADALPGRTFTGKVARIHPTVDPATRTFTAEVQVSNADRTLRPGMFARVKVEFGVNHSVVLPDVAVVKQQGSGQRFVFILENGTARSVAVTLGRHFDTYYEILEGVSEGDLVATRGSSGLKNGARVEIVENN